MSADNIRTVPLSFRALDPSLPLLAAQVAAEIDNVLVAATHGETSHQRIEALPQLADMLNNFRGSGHPGSQMHGMVDPISGNVLLRAYHDSFDGAQLSNKDLAAATDRLVESFSQAGRANSMSDETLKHLRDFCVALSNYAASKRRSVFGSRARHPFSR